MIIEVRRRYVDGRAMSVVHCVRGLCEPTIVCVATAAVVWAVVPIRRGDAVTVAVRVRVCVCVCVSVYVCMCDACVGNVCGRRVSSPQR